ncbi:MAG: hypothetical protein DRH70_04605, partial [Candidatus Coatesbacteria bacterium]
MFKGENEGFLMCRRFRLVCSLVICLFCVGVQFAEAGNELRPGEEIWECGDYAWRSLSVPVLDLPGEYDELPAVFAVDPDNKKWITSRYWYGDDYEHGTWYENDMTFDGVGFEPIYETAWLASSDTSVVIGKDRAGGEGYAAWAALGGLFQNDYNIAVRWQDGEREWWYPHTPQYPGLDGFAKDVAIDSTGLVWIAGWIEFGRGDGVFCIDGDPNVDESWSFVMFRTWDYNSYIDCGGGRINRCLLGFNWAGIGWVDQWTTSGTITDLESVGGSNDI